MRSELYYPSFDYPKRLVVNPKPSPSFDSVSQTQESLSIKETGWQQIGESQVSETIKHDLMDQSV